MTGQVYALFIVVVPRTLEWNDTRKVRVKALLYFYHVCRPDLLLQKCSRYPCAETPRATTLLCSLYQGDLADSSPVAQRSGVTYRKSASDRTHRGAIVFLDPLYLEDGEGADLERQNFAKVLWKIFAVLYNIPSPTLTGRSRPCLGDTIIGQRKQFRTPVRSLAPSCAILVGGCWCCLTTSHRDFRDRRATYRFSVASLGAYSRWRRPFLLAPEGWWCCQD